MDQYFSLIAWPKPFVELFEFVGLFLAIGAIGFRFSALRGRLHGDDATYHRIARRAAIIGLIGALLTLYHIFDILPQVAARENTTVGGILSGWNVRSFWFYLTTLSVLAFVAALRLPAAWYLAGIGVIGGVVRNVFWGQIERMVTPMHILTGGLWIGTLFVLVGAGLAGSRRDERRGVIVADMVNAFSPLALTCGFGVIAFGVWASLREFEPFSAVWTTPRGYTLIAKVCTVALVLALGAWNWRKQRPVLGSDGGADSIRRSATYELIAAFVVLFLTSVMLSLPEAH